MACLTLPIFFTATGEPHIPSNTTSLPTALSLLQLLLSGAPFAVLASSELTLKVSVRVCVLPCHMGCRVDGTTLLELTDRDLAHPEEGMGMEDPEKRKSILQVVAAITSGSSDA